ncbi:two-component system QseEF-associated lipoprotein QseG [Serratia symbiotica]|uniref:two-component system QseEF-associated lipoprotein QseG n=1 Tax=Serratia symbiotica TaxID=138074 RepID=UPI00135FCAF2|nr:two-component system QseEF-associated lipoprotein QseG [Serratia symbiotica]MBQ0957159.1 two-component system QseEF-associated lipoprotein QseG [Serratia symbiotica]
MYTGSNCLRLPQTEPSLHATRRALLGKRPMSFLSAAFVMPLLLTGCVQHASSNDLSQQQQEAIPRTKVVDYRLAACDTLWQLNEEEALDNSLYWLRAIDCADRMGPTQARALAKNLPDDSGFGIFKQSILLGSAEPTTGERRQMIDRLNSAQLALPNSLQPLLQLWRQQQVLQITLLDEKAHYQRLQESADSRIDTLHQALARLQAELQDTSRKLEDLTDIERQLSTRKQLQGEIPESSTVQLKADATVNNSAPVRGADPKSAPENSSALPVATEDTAVPPPANNGSHAQ